MLDFTFHPGLLPNDPTKDRIALGATFFSVAPAPKPTINYYSALTNLGMLLNDQLGDCTIAQAGHGINSWSKYGQGAQLAITDAQALTAYEAVGGYRPGDPSTDQGAVLQDVLNYWRKTGIGGHKITAFAELTTTNFTTLHQAVEIFDSVTIGFNFPKIAMTQFQNDEAWDVVKNDGGLDGGHAVDVVGYDAANKMLYVITWGAVQKMTEAFWTKYVTEAWVVIAPEWLSAKGTSPEGLDLYGLGEDFAALTDEPNPFPEPTPAPTPAPTPQPQPVPTPTPVPPQPPAPVTDADGALAEVLHAWIAKDPFFYHGVQKAAATWLASKDL